MNPFQPLEEIEVEFIPDQINKVPFIWNYYGTEIKMSIYGGFLGAHYDTKTKVASPSHFWCVAYDKEDAKEKKTKSRR